MSINLSLTLPQLSSFPVTENIFKFFGPIVWIYSPS